MSAPLPPPPSPHCPRSPSPSSRSSSSPDRKTTTTTTTWCPATIHAPLRHLGEARRARRRALLAPVCVVVVMQIYRTVVDVRMVAVMQTTYTKARTGTGKGFVSSNDDANLMGGEHEYSSGALLPWLPWERHAMVNGSCHAPSDVPDRCCVGSSSNGGGMFVSKVCLAKGTEPYDRVKERASEFLLKHPVPPPMTPSWWFRARSVPTDCDMCRIMDHLIANNYTLTFQGDSVMGQVFSALECELLRRGYAINSTKEGHEHVEGFGWRYGLRVTETLRVSAPSPRITTADGGLHRRSDGRRTDDDDDVAVATVVYRAMYRPLPDMQQVKTILDETDIYVFDHGLHYGTQDQESMNEFRNSTEYILKAVQTSARTKMVAWKETTPQHFNTSGGHWADSDFNCVPITEDYEGVYRTLVEQAAQDAGYARVVNATEVAPRTATAASTPSRGEGQAELVVLPFRDFLIPFHDLHGEECTHFCSSSYMYVPLWRGLRLALDAYLS